MVIDVEVTLMSGDSLAGSARPDLPFVGSLGDLEQLSQGDSVAFPAGTGIAHTFINNSREPVKLLIVGEHSADDRVVYPLDPEVPHPRPWTDAPPRPLGDHDGQPDDPLSSD